jgi:pyruvate-ferredoxin/flavodoxin oxidoreductase
VTHTSLVPDLAFTLEPADEVRAVFYGLGADGTVGANKNSAKIIAEDAGLYSQAYFVYDSHKSGAQTVSHLRFGPKPIHAPYLITSASFVACHQFHFLERLDVLRIAAPGATFLLNTVHGADEVWDHLPRSVQKEIIDKRLKFFVIDASNSAREAGLPGLTNTILQTCFFAISGVLPRQEELRSRRWRVGQAVRSKGTDLRHQRVRSAPYCAEISACLCADLHGDGHAWTGR